MRLVSVPPQGAEVQRLFQTRTRVAVQRRDVPTGRMDPPEFRESAQLGRMKQVLLLGVTGDPLWHLSFDSLVSRVRDGGGAWRELTVGGLDTLWVQVDLDERGRVGDARTRSPHPGRDLLVELATGLPGLSPPVTAVGSGSTWVQEIEMPLSAFAARPPAGAERHTLGSRLGFAVDSLVPRERDTLAYVSFRGDFRAKVQPFDDGSVRRSSGWLVGTLIWSSGWRTIVSQSVRMQVRIAVHVDGTPTAAMRELAILDTTVQTQVNHGS